MKWASLWDFFGITVITTAGTVKLFTCRKSEAVGNVEADKPLIELFSSRAGI
jgi:hypothetical protein